MNTAMQGFDSRSMPLAEPSTAPSALSWWRWFGHRGRTSATRDDARNDAQEVRDEAAGLQAGDGQAAADPGAAADRPQGAARR